jgi:hypothetical protein
MADGRFPNEEEVSSLYINILVLSIILWIIFAFYIICIDLIIPIKPNTVWENINKSNVLENVFINVPLLYFIL